MLIEDKLHELASWNVAIYASDISKPVLARAREGLYRQDEVNRGLGSPALTRHFVRQGDVWAISSTIKRAVQFEQVNLIGAWPHTELFDLILLRNVLIYFDQKTRLSVLCKLRQHLVDEGYLLIGGSETLPPEIRLFERVPIARASVYRAVRMRLNQSSHAR